MGKYSISDFQVGDSVYHLSNASLKMVVIDINTSLYQVTCRWIDASGLKYEDELFPQELGKSSDLGLGIYLI